MSHYFSEVQDVKSVKKIINYEIKNEKFEFLTDNGVFSKTKVDFGTDVMLRTFLNENKKLENIRILDIGCGYGVVSVVVKRFFEKAKILSTDVNERALELTRENIQKNNRTDDEKSFFHLNKNGKFYCVIQTKHGAKSTKKKLEELFGNCTTLVIEAGYRIFRCVKNG